MRIGFPATHLTGEQKRLMWANAIRVEIAPEGNFGDKLCMFSGVIGDPPTLRVDYPGNKLIEKYKAGAQSDSYCNPLNGSPPKFIPILKKSTGPGKK